MAFHQFKTVAGNRIKLDMSKVLAFEELPDSTAILLANGETVNVSDSYQTVSNRAKESE